MTTVNLDDAQAHLKEIISGLNPGEELIIVEDGELLATLIRNRSTQWACAAGSAKRRNPLAHPSLT